MSRLPEHVRAITHRTSTCLLYQPQDVVDPSGVRGSLDCPACDPSVLADAAPATKLVPVAAPSREYFRTVREVKNPSGDPRSNRAHWRSPIDKSVIEPGFVWYVDHERWLLVDGHKRYDYRHLNNGDSDNQTLLENLREASEPWHETIDTVLADFGQRADTLLERVCKAKGITPTELRAILDAAEES